MSHSCDQLRTPAIRYIVGNNELIAGNRDSADLNWPANDLGCVSGHFALTLLFLFLSDFSTAVSHGWRCQLKEYARMKTSLCLLILLAATFGCSGSGAPTQTVFKPPQWPALDKLSSDDVRSMVMSAEMGDWDSVKREVSTPEFKAAVDAFASTEVPEEFATDARKQAKEDAAKKFQALVAAGSGTGSIQETYKAAQDSLAEVRKPDPVE